MVHVVYNKGNVLTNTLNHHIEKHMNVFFLQKVDEDDHKKW